MAVLSWRLMALSLSFIIRSRVTVSYERLNTAGVACKLLHKTATFMSYWETFIWLLREKKFCRKYEYILHLVPIYLFFNAQFQKLYNLMFFERDLFWKFRSKTNKVQDVKINPLLMII